MPPIRPIRPARRARWDGAPARPRQDGGDSACRTTVRTLVPRRAGSPCAASHDRTAPGTRRAASNAARTGGITAGGAVGRRLAVSRASEHSRATASSSAAGRRCAASGRRDRASASGSVGRPAAVGELQRRRGGTPPRARPRARAGPAPRRPGGARGRPAPRRRRSARAARRRCAQRLRGRPDGARERTNEERGERRRARRACRWRRGSGRAGSSRRAAAGRRPATTPCRRGGSAARPPPARSSPRSLMPAWARTSRAPGCRRARSTTASPRCGMPRPAWKSTHARCSRASATTSSTTGVRQSEGVAARVQLDPRAPAARQRRPPATASSACGLDARERTSRPPEPRRRRAPRRWPRGSRRARASRRPARLVARLVEARRGSPPASPAAVGVVLPDVRVRVEPLGRRPAPRARRRTARRGAGSKWPCSSIGTRGSAPSARGAVRPRGERPRPGPRSTLAQLGQAEADAALGRAERHVGAPRDLVRRQAAPVRQHDRLALGGGQLGRARRAPRGARSRSAMARGRSSVRRLVARDRRA